ncbi:uncharacterized protein [Coffea arabica]|uniref:SWIM-type domain-containing protein n=1 Tax=Coffea arabica TaxID=13443 RepID=A0A6P6T029_COFAR|nr:uncharacterized protein LOC113696458 [Coffea arabica]
MINIDDIESKYDSDGSFELKSQSQSNEDGNNKTRRPRFSVFNEQTDMKKSKFEIGLKFTSVIIFRLAVRIQAIMDGRDVYFKKNDTRRVKVKYRSCDWQLFGSKMQDENTFQIKIVSDEHTCERVFHNKNMISRLASKLFVDKVRKTPSMTVHELMTKVNEELNVDFSLKQEYRTLRKVRDTIQGSYDKQYTMLESFCGELRRANPGFTVFIEIDIDEDGVSRFRKLYMCLEPIKRDFLAGCRKWIGLDGCFLKGPYGGQLLSAVGMDDDNKMFPLAMSVVGAENYDNWNWFLGLLVQDLKIEDSSCWCIMTDKQKGLLQAVRDKLPQAEHRYCVQHLYTNFKQMHRGLALKDRLWRCARVSYMTQFKAKMEIMNQESKDAYAWLDEKDPNTWSMAHFKIGLDCNILVNNMCESFNSVILKARSLPIIGLLCPAIFDILEKAKKEQCICICYYAGTMKYQICYPFGDQFVVDLGSKTCTCRKWQLRGTPYGHAVAAIYKRRDKPEKNVAPIYWKSTYMKSYEPMLNPIYRPNLWVPVDLPPMKPPKYRKTPGRPTKGEEKGTR